MRHLAGMAAGCVAVAVVLTLLLLLLLQALLGICSGMRRLLGQPGAVVACWRRVAFDARSRADGVDPEVEQQVREHLSDRCLHLSHRLTPVLAVIMAPQAVMVAFQLLGGLSPGRSTAQQVACIALFVGPAVSTLFPRSAGARGTAALHLLLMVAGHIDTSPFFAESQANWALMAARSCGETIAFSFLCLGSPVLAAVTNILDSLLWILSIVRFVSADDGYLARELIAFNLLALCFKGSVLWFVATLLRQGVWREVESRADACQRSAASLLLGMMCDAVVDLDQRFEMKEHVSQLATILMHGSGKSLQGCALSEFVVAGEDRRLFEDALACPEGLSPRMLTVRLRDAVGGGIRTVLYHVPYLSIAGRTHHLVGMREDTGSFQEPEKPSVKDDEELAAPSQALLFSPSAGRERRQQRRSGRASSSAGSSCSSAGEEDDLTLDVWATERLPISRVSERMRRKFGIGDAVGRSFRDMLSADAGERLTDWIAEQSRRVVEGTSQPFIGTFGDVELADRAGSEAWSLEVCFPRLHPELRRRQTYLVGIRLKRSRTCGRGTCRTLSPQQLRSPTCSGRRMLGKSSL